jgi:hypothetical protein
LVSTFTRYRTGYESWFLGNFGTPRNSYCVVQNSLDFLGVQTRLPHTHIDFINSMTIAIPLMSKILSYSLRNGLFYNARTTFLDVVFRILDGLSRRHNSKRPPARTTRPFTFKNTSISQHYSTASIACRKKISMQLSSLFLLEMHPHPIT